MATRKGLGRGLGGLIPSNQSEPKDRPIDIFFGNATPKAEQEAPALSKDDAKDSNQESRTGEPTTKKVKARAAAKGTPKKTTTKPQEEPESGRNDHAEVPSNANVSRETLQESAEVTLSDSEELVAVPGATYGEIPIGQIVPNQKQPRQVFDEDDLDELTASIREVGVLQPIIVRPLTAPIPDNPEARYELIMGERRWRATTQAGLDTIPAIVRHTADEDLLRDALLENLHRAQLNPLEEAAAYQQLLEDFNCTQEELARRIARSRPQITNTLRLMKLPPLVQSRVAAGVLSAGHARALLGLQDPAAMERLAQRIVAEGISVRQTEELVALGEGDAEAPQRPRRIRKQIPELTDLAVRLGDRFDTRVKVDMGKRKGSIKIDFATIEDLNRILAILSPGEEVFEELTRSE